MMRGFEISTASRALQALARAAKADRWAPTADGGAVLYDWRDREVGRVSREQIAGAANG